MKRIRAFGWPWGVVLGIVCGAEREADGLIGAGSADLEVRLKGEHRAEFTMPVKFFEPWPGVTVLWGNQRRRAS